tara:strand:- start:885 stop:1127 length:243 start_codon:yes stop_codon:yes gene_type:complete
MSNSIDDADLEFLLDIYVAAKQYIPIKDKVKFADAFLIQLKDYEIDIELNAEEITGVDEYLEEAFDTIIEQEDEEDEDEW